MEVNELTPCVKAMRESWQLADALMDGTEAMRAHAKTYLPQWPLEQDSAYQARLSVSVLLPTFQRTVRVMSAKPFAKQLTLSEDVSPKMRELLVNCDQQGNTLHAFASELMPRILSHGLHLVLVEHTRVPPREPAEGEAGPPAPATMADALAVGARPYFVSIECHRFLGLRTQTENGVERVTQVRIQEDTEVDDGDFGTKLLERVRVLRPGGWRLYERASKDAAWEIKGEGETKPINDEIPLVFFYGVKKGLGHGVSPLKELAHSNVKHWQSQSDQDNILHYARVPLLVTIGDEEKTAVQVGGSATQLPLGADMKWVEHSGAATVAGQTSLDALEAQMLQIGAELLIKQPGAQKTATESNSEADANKSDLQRIVEQAEAGLDRCLGFMARFVGEEPKGHASLYKEFGANTLTDASQQIVNAMATAGFIRKVTAVKEAQRRGHLSADIEAEKEVELAKDEYEPLPQFVPPADPAANEDDDAKAQAAA